MYFCKILESNYLKLFTMKIHFDSPLEQKRAVTSGTNTVADYFFANGTDSVEWLLAKSGEEIERLRRMFLS